MATGILSVSRNLTQMEIAREYAIDVLAEWRRRKKIIQGGMMDSLQNNAAIFGCIEELNPDSVRIDARSIAPNAKNFGVVLRLNDASFSFGEWPTAPPDYSGDYAFVFESYLIMTFSNGTRCELFATNL
jgi:hypothetical protein